jgi:DNA-binding response OmpR family regulator
MFIPRQILPAPASAPENISILVVSPHPDDLTCLRHMLNQRDWRITLSTHAAEATREISVQNPSVIICERDLPDGTWKDILRHTERMAHAPLLLVVSRHADENLWAEVLNLGGYDVLLKPFDGAELVRVVGMAWRSWMSGFSNAAAPIGMTSRFA